MTKAFCTYLFLLLSIQLLCALPVAATSKIEEGKRRYNTLYTDWENTLWMGCENGLYQWKDRTSYKVISDSSLNVTALYANGNIVLIGTAKGQLYLFDKYLKKLTLAGDMKAEISDICIHDNMIAIASKGNGYVIISPYDVRHFTTREGLTDNFVYNVLIAPDHSMWSSTDKGINIHHISDQISGCCVNQKLPDRLITCFDKKDSILICGTQQGDICRINLHDSSVNIFDHTIWHSGQINDIKILDHTIAIATGLGAYLLDMNGNLIETINNEKPLQHIESDNEANIWFCGDRLLISSTGEQITMIRNLGNAQIANVHALFIDQNENMFFTPDQGLMKLNLTSLQKNQIKITPPKELIDITSIYSDPYGNLWVGTFGKGLYLANQANLNFKKIDIDSSVETSAILSITGDKQNIWVSSLNGVWHSGIDNGSYHFQSLEDEYGKKKYYVYDVKKDSKGNLWLATDGQGVLKISGRKVSNYSSEKKIRSKVFYTIEEDANGQIWLNAFNEGIYCLAGDSVIHLTQNNGLSSNDNQSFISFQKKFMIVASSVGIDLIDIENFGVSSFNFGSLHLSQTPEINAISSDQQGNTYIGTNNGLIKLYIPSYKIRFLPVARIDEISVLDKPILRENSQFDYEENYFKFKISANYNSDQTIYFRYKLKGLSEHWNQTIDKAPIFPRLNPGKYEFILQAANNSQFLNASEDQYSFVVLSPFWQQNWFIFLTLCLITLSIYYYIRFRESRVSRVQQLEKEKAIAEFETLKHQVSPHFLFNSFNTLIQVIDEDKEKAIEYTQMLSDYYRTLLSYHKVNLVSLEEEFMLLDKYIYLQKMRFGDSLRLDNTCTADQIRDLEIPPLTLQLLAENAIKHNIVSGTKPLTISIFLQSDFLIISNRLNEKNGKEAGENIGLQNIKNRFKLFSRLPVEIHKTNENFEVRLPILKP